MSGPAVFAELFLFFRLLPGAFHGADKLSDVLFKDVFADAEADDIAVPEILDGCTVDEASGDHGVGCGKTYHADTPFCRHDEMHYLQMLLYFIF